MFASIIEHHGGPEVLKWAEFPDPKPGPGEVAVELEAASLNHLDIWVRNGIPAYPVKLPHIPGSDGAGVVISHGSGVKDPQVGQRVFIAPGLSCGTCEFCLSGRDNQCASYNILGARRPGTYGERVSIPAQNAVPLPDNISFEEGAAFPLTYLTAWHMLVSRASLKAGQSVLVIAASSGVGAAAVQISRLVGARVFATASSPEKSAKARAMGVVEVFNHRQPGFSRKVRELTNGRGVDVVFEHVGPATWSDSMRSLAPYGCIVTCGGTTGPEVTVDLRTLFSKDISLLGARMGTRLELLEVAKRLSEGKLKVMIDKVFPAHRAAEAQTYLESSQHFGKILLKFKD